MVADGIVIVQFVPLPETPTPSLGTSRPESGSFRSARRCSLYEPLAKPVTAVLNCTWNEVREVVNGGSVGHWPRPATVALMRASMAMVLPRNPPTAGSVSVAGTPAVFWMEPPLSAEVEV